MSRSAALKARPTANPSSPWLVNLPSRFTSSGKRERHFFKKKTEADEFARRQRIRLENYGSSGAVLPAGRVEEAAIAFERLNPLGVSLTQVVDEYVARREREGKSVTLREAFRRFEDFNPLRRSQAYRIQLAYTLRKFERLQDKLVASIARDEIEGALAGAPPSARNAFLRVLSAVFNYCIKRDWLETNPVQKVDRADVPRGAIKILQVGETRALLSACLDIDRELIPYHALGLFAGIRPNELNRMVWEQIHMKDKEIKLPPDVVKTRNGRVIAIEPTLAKWLKFHVNTGGNRTGEIAPKNNQRKRLRAIRRKAGTVPWVQDVLRHSYASHWLKAFGDKGKLLGYMGHATDDMLLEHYLRAVDRKTAALYWKITPPGVPRKRGDEVHCAGT